MDQATNLEIKIIGQSMDVKRGALAAQRRIDLDTKGFDENAYTFGDGSDFETKMDEAVGILGNYNFSENDDGTTSFSIEQESYACVEEEDIVDIVNNIINVSPNVEIHIAAVITIHDNDLYVDIDYVNGELNVDSYEGDDDWEDEEDDE